MLAEIRGSPSLSSDDADEDMDFGQDLFFSGSNRIAGSDDEEDNVNEDEVDEATAAFWRSVDFDNPDSALG